MTVHAHRTEEVTGFKGREEAKGVGSGIGDKNGVGGGNKAVSRDGDEDLAGWRMGVDANERAQDCNGDGAGTRREGEREVRWRPVGEHRMGTGTGSERAEERQKSARNRTRVVDALWKTEETGEKRGKRRQERVGLVAADPENPKNRKEVWGRHKVFRA